MKERGIVRRVDELGRVVLPIELRRSLDLNERDRVEIRAEDDRIILRKFESNCCFCGNDKELREFRGKLLCPKCIKAIGEL